MKLLGESRPEKSWDPGILQKSRPENPGIKILENAGACLPVPRGPISSRGLFRLQHVLLSAYCFGAASQHTLLPSQSGVDSVLSQ